MANISAAADLAPSGTCRSGAELKGRAASVAALRLFEALPRHPIVSANSVIRILSTTKPTAGKAIDTPVAAGVLVETTGRRRDRLFAYEAYLKAQ
jgi:Fic family protein